MKQRISRDQLQELSDMGKERLKTWWKPEAGDIAVNDQGQSLVYNFNINTIKESSLPLLSIGQMIEFLDEHYGNQTIEYRSALLIDNQSMNTRDGGRWLAMKASNHKIRSTSVMNSVTLFGLP
jgi:hypothetical protein